MDHHHKIEHLNNEIKVRRNSLRSSFNNNNIGTQVNKFLFQSKEKTSNLLEVLKSKNKQTIS